jgi:hypothetical protein
MGMVDELKSLKAVAADAVLSDDLVAVATRKRWYQAENEYVSLELIKERLPSFRDIVLGLTEADAAYLPPREISRLKKACSEIANGNRAFDAEHPVENPLNTIKTGFNDLWQQRELDGLATRQKQLLAEAQKYVDRLAGHAFSNHFEREAQSLKVRQKLWFGLFVLTVLSLVALAFVAHYNRLDWETRLSIGIPGAAFLWLTIHHFGIISSLIREYRFKAVSAESMEGFRRQILDDRENDKAAEYILWAAKQIFSPPSVAPGTTPLEEIMKTLSKDARDVVKGAAGK